MTKTEFMKKCAEDAGMSQKDMREVLEIIGSNIVAHMKDEDGVTPFNGIKFTTVYKEARTGRNPMTGEPLAIAAKTSPKVKFGKAVKEGINE